jgi:integrase
VNLSSSDLAGLKDVRHGTATMLLAAGQPIKVISEILGHAPSAFTADVYTEVAQELGDSAVNSAPAPSACLVSSSNPAN